MAEVGTHDFRNTRGIKNLAASQQNGEPVVHQQLAGLKATYTSYQLITVNAASGFTAAIAAWGSVVEVDCTVGDCTLSFPDVTAAIAAELPQIKLIKTDLSSNRILPVVASGSNDVLSWGSSQDRVVRTRRSPIDFMAIGDNRIIVVGNVGKSADLVFYSNTSEEWKTKNCHIRCSTVAGAMTSSAIGQPNPDDIGVTIIIEHYEGTNQLTLTNGSTGVILNPLGFPLTSTTPGVHWFFKGVAVNTWSLVDCTLPPSGGGVANGDKGDITVTGGGATWTIDNQAVTLAKIQDIATASFLGRTSALAGSAEVLTATQATALLDTVTASAKGLIPSPGTPTGRFFKDDLTWGAIAASTTAKTISQLKTDLAGNAIIANALYRITDEKALHIGNAANDTSVYYPDPLIERSRRLIVDNDFLIGTTTALGFFLGSPVGTGTINAVAGSVNNPGQIRLRSSSSANNGYRVGSDTGAIILKGGEKCLFYVNFFTTAGIQNRLGFLNSANVAVAPDGAHFEVNAGVLSIRSVNNGTTTVGATTLNVTQGTWYALYIEVNSAGTSINFRVFNYADGVQLYNQSLGTNLPVGTGRTTGFQVLSTTSATVITDLILIDYMGAEFYPARPSLQFA